MRNIERAQEELRAPRGKFRVMEIDKFYPAPEGQKVIADFDDRQEALKLARQASNANRAGSDYSIACVYYVYDDQGHYLGGDVWVGE